MADEVEDVHRRTRSGHGEERVLQRLLPRERRAPARATSIAARVRERLRPVRLHREARDLVGRERAEDDRDLRNAVARARNVLTRAIAVIRSTVASIAAMPLFLLALAFARRSRSSPALVLRNVRGARRSSATSASRRAVDGRRARADPRASARASSATSRSQPRAEARSRPRSRACERRARGCPCSRCDRRRARDGRPRDGRRARASESRGRRPRDELDAAPRRGRRTARLEEVESRRLTITRLGEGVDERRRLLPVPIARVRNVLSDYRRELEALGAERTLASRRAPSATPRTARRSSARSSGATASRRGCCSGDEEALLTLRGDRRALEPGTLVVDIGGGSTELQSSGDGRRVRASTSAACA